MGSPQRIRSRLRAVRNIGDIAKAMEAVSATKMRRAQELAIASRPYALKSLQLLAEITRSAPLEHPLLAGRPIARTLLLVIASDRGLAGAFNAQVARITDSFLAGDPYRDDPGHAYLVVAVGKKAEGYARKRGLEIVRSFSGFGDYAEPEETGPLAEFTIRGFLTGRWDRLIALSTHFRTTLKQETLLRQVLPADIARIRETVAGILPERGRYAELPEPVTQHAARPTDYLFEPSPRAALEALIPHLVRIEIHHLVLEANASEHSARRVAMKNASDNAGELAQSLTLAANRARQAAITKEVVEIASTKRALEPERT